MVMLSVAPSTSTTSLPLTTSQSQSATESVTVRNTQRGVRREGTGAKEMASKHTRTRLNETKDFNAELTHADQRTATRLAAVMHKLAVKPADTSATNAADITQLKLSQQAIQAQQDVKSAINNAAHVASSAKSSLTAANSKIASSSDPSAIPTDIASKIAAYTANTTAPTSSKPTNGDVAKFAFVAQPNAAKDTSVSPKTMAPPTKSSLLGTKVIPTSPYIKPELIASTKPVPAKPASESKQELPGTKVIPTTPYVKPDTSNSNKSVNGKDQSASLVTSAKTARTNAAHAIKLDTPDSESMPVSKSADLKADSKNLSAAGKSLVSQSSPSSNSKPIPADKSGSLNDSKVVTAVQASTDKTQQVNAYLINTTTTKQAAQDAASAKQSQEASSATKIGSDSVRTHPGSKAANQMHNSVWTVSAKRAQMSHVDQQSNTSDLSLRSGNTHSEASDTAYNTDSNNGKDSQHNHGDSNLNSFAGQITSTQTHHNANQTVSEVKVVNASPSERAAVIKQISDTISSAAKTPEAKHTVSINVHPDHWGELKITLTMGGEHASRSGVTANIVAENNAVRDSLIHQEKALRHALQTSGVHLNRLEVTASSISAGMSSNTPDQNSQHQRNPGQDQQSQTGYQSANSSAGSQQQSQQQRQSPLSDPALVLANRPVVSNSSVVAAALPNATNTAAKRPTASSASEIYTSRGLKTTI